MLSIVFVYDGRKRHDGVLESKYGAQQVGFVVCFGSIRHIAYDGMSFPEEPDFWLTF
jgi:hypothetical protein